MLTLQTKRGSTAALNYENPVLAAGEIGYDTTLKQIKIGDGTTAWTALPWLSKYVYSISEIAGLETRLTTIEGNISTGSTDLTNHIAAANPHSQYVLLNQLAVANGVATLDGDGKVPSSQLPSYVDDVLEYANFAALPVTGETSKIYVTLDDNKTYRWTGTVYVAVAASPGTTDEVPEGATNLYYTDVRAQTALASHTTNNNIHVPAGGTDNYVLKSFGGSPQWSVPVFGDRRFYGPLGGAQSTFNINYDIGANGAEVDVYVEGHLLNPSEYIATNGTSITLNTPAQAGMNVSLIGATTDAFSVGPISDRKTYGPLAGPQSTFNIAYDIGGNGAEVDVYLDGHRLNPDEYTATTGTNVTLNIPANAGSYVVCVASTTGIAASDHSALTNIQGGQVGQYYHLNKNNYDKAAGYLNGVYTNNSATGTINVDINGGTVSVINLVMVGNITLNLLNTPPGPHQLAIKVKQDATGGRSITWSAQFKMPKSGAPTLSATANEWEWLSAIAIDGGGQYDLMKSAGPYV